jgi:hypothetical protein
MPDIITVDSLLTELVAGRLQPTVLSHLERLPRSPAVVGNTVGRDQEITLQWGDAGGKLADSNPTGAGFKRHGQATWKINPTDTHFGYAPFQNTAWSNCYMFAPLPFPAVIPTHLVDVRRFSMTAAELKETNCRETDFQITANGFIHNMGWQFNVGLKMLRYFTYATGGKEGFWNQTDVPLPDMTQPVDFLAEFKIDEKTTTHVAVNINGKRYPLNITQPATPTKNGNKFTIAEQLDSKVEGRPLGITIFNTEARYL